MRFAQEQTALDARDAARAKRNMWAFEEEELDAEALAEEAERRARLPKRDPAAVAALPPSLLRRKEAEGAEVWGGHVMAPGELPLPVFVNPELRRRLGVRWVRNNASLARDYERELAAAHIPVMNISPDHIIVVQGDATCAATGYLPPAQEKKLREVMRVPEARIESLRRILTSAADATMVYDLLPPAEGRALVDAVKRNPSDTAAVAALQAALPPPFTVANVLQALEGAAAPEAVAQRLKSMPMILMHPPPSAVPRADSIPVSSSSSSGGGGVAALRIVMPESEGETVEVSAERVLFALQLLLGLPAAPAQGLPGQRGVITPPQGYGDDVLEYYADISGVMTVYVRWMRGTEKTRALINVTDLALDASVTAGHSGVLRLGTPKAASS